MTQSLSVFKLPENSLQTEKLRFLLAVLFVFFLPFDKFYSTLIFGLLIVTTLLDISIQKLKNIPRQCWIFQIIYFLTILGYVYSSNKAEAGFLLERQLSFLLFPVILPLAFEFSNERANTLFKSLSISCTLTIIGLFAYLFYLLKVTGTPISEIFSPIFLNHKFSDPIGIHAGYLSLYVSLSIFFVLKELMHAKLLFKKCIILFSLIVLVAGLTFLASRNAFISTLLIIITVFPLFYIKRKTLFLIGFLGIIGVGALVITKVDYLKERFSTQLIEDINPGTNDYNKVEPRIDRWKFALELIAESPWIGYGTGDEVLMLKTKYKQNNFFVSYYSSFNAHNQYLSYLLKNGILGLVIFLGAFIYYFKLAVKSKNFMYISLLLLMLIGFFTENILDANKGIFFFAFFNTFLGYTALSTPSGKDPGIIS